jgi:PHD/YefM family antitoxin component YafN of YafNO toxin-antitoxin module
MVSEPHKSTDAVRVDGRRKVCSIQFGANGALSPSEAGMVDIVEDIQSLTAFRRASAEVVRRLKKTRRAIVLTINGKAALVLQDATSYQRLLDIEEQHETRLAIHQALEDMRECRSSRISSRAWWMANRAQS